MVVVAIIALASAVVSVSLPDGDQTRLAREAQRLVTLLETARGHARAQGASVTWIPGPFREDGSGPAFRFQGLPESIGLPDQWLDPSAESRPSVRMTGEAGPQSSARLGPEPYIGPQRIELRLGQQQATLVTDGLAPFRIQATEE